ncbi:hypothetical protein GGE66_002441 [Rhizobium leguminosarum]|uniref:Uncharacterized protein n=1 Tax=Rhizobium leguminosarum TaxID=384 RepID=A0A7W9ZSN0_RHILE|nr:hypothetical protein [Rhizobium leguminosarum]
MDHLDSKGAVFGFFECDRLDMRADDSPLTSPVIAHGLTTMDMAALHAVGPGDIIRKDGKDRVNVSGVEAGINALDHLNIILRHIASPMVIETFAVETALSKSVRRDIYVHIYFGQARGNGEAE